MSGEPADVSEEEGKEELEEKDDYEESDQEGALEESSNEADYSNSEKKDLNDEFFDLNEFNRQTLEAEEGEGNEQDDEEVDYFGDLPSEDEEEALYYNDFFDEPTSQKSTKKEVTSEKPKKKQQAEPDFTEEDYDAAVDSAKLDLFADDDKEPKGGDEDTDSEKKLSTFEKQQLDIQRQIEQLEKEAVAEKKWALKGEAQSKDRPQDALLEEDVEFDRTSKPVPVITTEVTESLEDMIRRRIKEKGFDDLPRRVVTDSNLKSYKPDFQLSDQKSSKSLAELYEEDYKGVSQDAAVSEELQKEHDEISDMFNNLFYKLDALSSAHFIPKPSKKSLEVRVETPAVSMEDTQPLTMSTEQSLAPQEIYRVGKGENPNEIKLKNGMPVAKEELTRDDKQRLRRAMKRKRANNHVGDQQKKKSKKDATISTLSNAKNVTVINKKGEQHDVRGNVKGTKGNENINKIKL
ncbi:U3 small nucleolar ribonucleoprotein complex, subunit Mpp10 [Zygosaccharomyces rouxii]|nr:U3 small nucleolar ribonucleoprotein complex, subunit Mpp10 [Zygosaccharomyces rouxii]